MEDGNRGLQANTFANLMFAYSGTPAGVRDEEGGFRAFEYVTDASKGTLNMSNADQDLKGNILKNGDIQNMRIVGLKSQNAGFFDPPGGEGYFVVDDGTESDEGDLYFVYEDSGGTQKLIQITDFSAGSTA
jgi:hypothetical protein